MFCPNCGSRNSSEQKFCRSCGMNLEQTALNLAHQFGDDDGPSRRSVDRFFESLGKLAFGGLGAVIVIGIGYLIYAVITRFILDGSRITFGVFLILFIAFAALSLTYVIYKEGRKDRKPRTLEDTPNRFSAPDTDKLLNEPSQMPIPSVVEETTDLLGIESKTRRL